MTSAEVRTKIISRNRRFMKAFEQKDAAAIAKLYTAGSQLLPPGSDSIGGQQAIQAFWQRAMDLGLAQATLETVEVESYRETAIEIGKYTLVSSSGQVADGGKYLVIWKVEGRSWKLHRDIWNSSQPRPAS